MWGYLFTISRLTKTAYPLQFSLLLTEPHQAMMPFRLAI